MGNFIPPVEDHDEEQPAMQQKSDPAGPRPTASKPWVELNDPGNVMMTLGRRRVEWSVRMGVIYCVTMLYAVSEKYKESGSCRLEASYARELGVDMIPLAVQEGYSPSGWLRLVSRALGLALLQRTFGADRPTDAPLVVSVPWGANLARVLRMRGRGRCGV